MSESEHVAAAPLPDSPAQPRDRRGGPATAGFRRKGARCGRSRRRRDARASWSQPLHPADVADLIELAERDEREGAGQGARRDRQPDVLAEMNDYVREDLLDELEPQQVADIAGQLDTDDAVALIEDLDRDDQQAVLQRDGARRPRRGRGSAGLSGRIRRPPDAARPVRGARALERRPGHRLSALDEDLPDRFLGSVRRQTRPIIRSAPASCR